MTIRITLHRSLLTVLRLFLISHLPSLFSSFPSHLSSLISHLSSSFLASLFAFTNRSLMPYKSNDLPT